MKRTAGQLGSGGRTRKRTEAEILAMDLSARCKLLCSRAYHQATDPAVREGKSKEEAREIARTASAKKRQELLAEEEGAANPVGLEEPEREDDA